MITAQLVEMPLCDVVALVSLHCQILGTTSDITVPIEIGLDDFAHRQDIYQ
jgi:hypothetical protein